MTDRKAVVKNADMSEDMQQEAVDVATQVYLLALRQSCPLSSLATTIFSNSVYNCVVCVLQAMEKFNIEKDIAAFIKKEFDKKFNPTWHCIVGRNFGSYVTHETKHFVYFYMGQVAVLLFKSG